MKLPPRLAARVVKDGVSLGLLGDADRSLALAACALPTGRAHREADVNQLLGHWLEGAGAMLRTDHVELRRWLVDAGFVSRDGFGREYVRGGPKRREPWPCSASRRPAVWVRPFGACARQRRPSARPAARLSQVR